MRSSRILGVLIVVAVLVAPVNVFAKVCHPKKPVTCHAVSLADSQSLKPATQAQPQFQQAMVCGYFPRWMCKANTLSAPVQQVKPATKSQTPVQQAMVCGYFPRWMCKANTLGAPVQQVKPATKSQTPVQQAMVCGYFPRWMCRANTLS